MTETYDAAKTALESFIGKKDQGSLECRIGEFNSTIELKDGYYVINFHHDDGWEWPSSYHWEKVAKKYELERHNIFFYGPKDVIIAEIQSDFLRVKADHPKYLELADDLFGIYKEGIAVSKSRLRFLNDERYRAEAYVAKYHPVAIRDDTPKTRDNFHPSGWYPDKKAP